jgi:hypothetical protein
MVQGDGQRPPTVAQLRHKIDRGATGDKVNFPDPAAAPLGTDAEAGGAPPAAAERKTAYKAEVQRQPTPRQASAKRSVVFWLAALISVGVVLLLALLTD